MARLYELVQKWQKFTKGDDRPILCVDFDGVLHNQRGHAGDPSVIQNPPVPGALDWLAELQKSGLNVAIFTARLAGGGDAWIIPAIRRWLTEYGFAGDLDALKYTAVKPHNLQLLIDDRAFRFEGTFPTLEEIAELSVPWNEKYPQPLHKPAVTILQDA